VSKSVTGSVVNPGQQLTYTVSVANLGPDPAASLTITDPLPPGTTFVSCAAVPGTCSGPAVGTNGTVTADAGTLAAGATAQLTIVVRVTAGSGALVNTATASSSTPDPDSDNNHSTVVTSVGAGIPMASPPLLGLLALLLAGAGVWFLRRDG
jgi:uncharacterized repeat protein (TIGR01451 family)